MAELNFVLDGVPVAVRVRDLVIAGWTGRDHQAVEAHIVELEAIGVMRPETVPCFYLVGKELLTIEDEIDVFGSKSSGEVEFVLFSTEHGTLLGVGSDHTDRKIETYDITVSKQMCPKPIGRELWRMNEVRDHWDELVLRSWVTSGGKRRLYQEGSVARMRTPEDLFSRYGQTEDVLPLGTVMFCGTLPLFGALEYGDTLEVELEDRVLERTLRHRYRTRQLTVDETGEKNAY